MNTKKIPLAFLAIVILLLLGVLGYLVFQGSVAQAAGSKTPAGSWTVTVTPGDEPSFVDAAIFSSDGTVTIMEANGQLGIGVWEKTSHDSYAFTFWEYFGENDATIQERMSSTIQLSENGDVYNGPFSVEVYVDGKLVGSGGGTATGVRMHVEPMK
jgi:hypothetical protein